MQHEGAKQPQRAELEMRGDAHISACGVAYEIISPEITLRYAGDLLQKRGW